MSIPSHFHLMNLKSCLAHGTTPFVCGTQTGDPIGKPLERHSSSVNSVAFSSDGFRPSGWVASSNAEKSFLFPSWQRAVWPYHEIQDSLNISILELFLFYTGRLQKLLYILCYVRYTDSDSYVYKPVVSLKYDHITRFARYRQVLVHHLSS